MNGLTENDKNFGPFTFAKWTKRISIELDGGECNGGCHLLIVACGYALRVRLPGIVKPEREYGFALCDMGNGFDFFTVKYGIQTWDSSTEKSWSKHLPWKQWRCVRNSIYKPDGTHFATEKISEWRDWFKTCDLCPSVKFLFEDYDGEKIIATCKIEEREWHRGEGWFKWLRFFYPTKVRRSLDLRFDKEVGPEKGSWKGGTVGHGIEMLSGESVTQSFRRYCGKTHERKGRKFNLRFIGPLA